MAAVQPTKLATFPWRKQLPCGELKAILLEGEDAPGETVASAVTEENYILYLSSLLKQFLLILGKFEQMKEITYNYIIQRIVSRV